MSRPGADMMFTDQDIDYGVIDEAPFFHFAGVSLTKEPMRQATFTAVTLFLGLYPVYLDILGILYLDIPGMSSKKIPGLPTPSRNPFS